ncbi:lysophospholipid acyltransferase family protein [Ectopseudomonas hydrolytica]|jgi:1-acyl-sn-glycerol-3-phosphate acyltransferase|uniref:lysophospholipid acyltransferase family protein n=1 Tax=Ectopseudomonas hydrolytica TaxID=2493633 RepID=UPI0002786991|nr:MULTISPECIES: lysophospholipid acyltransferase family protein [Pseudomonas]ATH80298.1 acyltransferase [Pseudomonas mendocina]EJO91896.1 phospholipid/glycerol acyltransferase [Pseudomonas mendocina DLHK]MBF8162067.1 lysophospholipid acyltransferase family protein [Pseudomonas mendocina]UTH31304.1 lysophospholipid acyltransferase family protein [Pseudomonas hydrolytica]UTH36132.1 lysophospholipid acyltransferase family protein [Pseudomonas sp. KHPS1]
MSGNYLPRNPAAEWLGRSVLTLMGWRIEGELPKLDKFVAIGAHHTSNWDFVIFIALKFVLRLNARWFGKHSIFRWPFARLMRSWGGIPIRRDRQLNTVEQAVQAFREHDQFILVLSPEGTRKKVERWKMGFYHIALGAGVPIVLGALDYQNRRVVIGPTFQPTGDEKADLAAMLTFFRPYVPKKPEYAFHGD